jgi:tetratricopeptide (TPR) repeat protein
MFIFSHRTLLKNVRAYKILLVILVIVISGCSTKKNTWMSRNYQATNTRFNVYFNGNVSYNEGLKNILKANKEDYSSIIPMYPISKHSNATAATSNMDLTIEKCRKAIKLHSIKVKPDKNYKKANNPDYKLFYNQEEFNPALKEAWLLLGKAEFHKANFLGSVGTFSYIVRHYGTDKELEATCQLWIARAYGEMGWNYEAEQVMSKVRQDNLKRSNTGLYASVNADLLLKKHQYKDAIPFLELALSKETNSSLQQRFSFLLAQLYQKTKDNKAAYNSYTKVIKSNPPYEMEFNARINRAQLDQGKISNIRKELLKMLKNRNNKDYQDQLYLALGNTYLQHADTLKAIANYELSIEKSTRKGIDKAITLITLGDIYYKKRNYVKAQPCYDEAGKIITNENEDYARVTRLGEMLSELVTQYDIVVLQDSLQRLSAMPESKRLEVINKIIEKLNADEKAAAEKVVTDKQAAIDDAENSFTNMPPIGGGAGDWYFYNIDLMRKGEVEFVKKWGKRKLEDNWRRTNKATSLFAETTSSQTALKDSTDTISKTTAINDKKKPEFYLNQIPVTPAQLAKSTADIATALFTMGEIYRDKIEDIPMSISTFEEFIRRFKTDKRVVDAYFYIYLLQTKQGNLSEANLYRSKLLTEYPTSKYEKMLSQPDYANQVEGMYKVQDSIYNLTYKAYNASDFKTVYKQVAYIRQNFPLSTLMPKFLFLNALSVGKNETPELFRTSLNELVTAYPESDVSAMAKDILALMNQGQLAKTGTSSGSLLARRNESIKNEINEINEAGPQQFSTDKQTKHRLLLITSANQAEMNKLLYNVASFNFSRFLIKDFDLVVSKMDTAQNSLSVTNFESYDEAVWYENSVGNDSVLTKLMNDLKVQKVIISEDNYALIKTTFSLKDYLAFQSNPPAKKPVVQLAENKINKKQLPVSASISNNSIVKPINAPTTETVKQEKPAEVAISKPEVKADSKVNDKPIDKPVVSSSQPTPVTKENTTKTVADINATTKTVEPAKTVPAPVVKPKEEIVPLFKGLFGYRANEPHFIAIYIVSGTIDFEKTKAAINAYNSKNYAVMNLNVSLETVDKRQVIIIGSLTDAFVAKSYLIRMVKEKSIFEGLKGSSYRNLLGSKKNLNVLMQQNALNQYFEFMQQYYLK